MKKLSLLFVIILTISSCEQDAIVTEFEEFKISQASLAKKGEHAGKSKKVNVCHKGKILSVSVNALDGHQGHGDAIDMDGDGFFDIENDCSEIDCDDNNADFNPSTNEICNNGIDDNCDGYIDEGCNRGGH